jgi:uncharacterized membrane protein YqjE
MEPVPPASAGFLRSLRLLADGLLARVQHRIQLFAIEVQEQKLRLIRTFIWISAAVFSAAMTLTFASLTVVYLFWASARLTVFIVLTIVYAAALAWIIVALRRLRARETKPFAATLHELGEDRACIRPGN